MRRREPSDWRDKENVARHATRAALCIQTFLAKTPHLEAMLEVGETIPAPTSEVDFVELETVA